MYTVQFKTNGIQSIECEDLITALELLFENEEKHIDYLNCGIYNSLEIERKDNRNNYLIDGHLEYSTEIIETKEGDEL